MGEIQEDGHLEKDNRLNGTSTVPLESTSKTVPVAFDARSKQRLGAYNTSPWRCHSAPTTPFPVVSTENLLYPVHSNLEMIFFESGIAAIQQLHAYVVSDDDYELLSFSCPRNPWSS